MSREITFRAWDEQNKIMHFDFQFFTSGEEGNDWICFSSDKEKRNTGDTRGIVFNNPYFRQQLKVMQFTGLKDKNGKDIYEGDIIWEEYRHIKAIVLWRQESCQFVRQIIREKGYWELYRVDSWRYEIIGNIHENPELLEKKAV